jgi:(R,R)-butanediol dehydrogenase/meso-butanediol dehydrogenase/diacetyl reductase
MCYALPEDVDLGLAALIEPLAVAMHAVRISGFADFHDLNVLILGGGPIGHAVAQTLKVRGTRQVIVSEPALLRRQQIRHLTDAIIDPTTQDVASECRKLTHGSGVDMVFDCAGAIPAMNAAFSALKIRGTYINLAVAWSSPVSNVRDNCVNWLTMW